MEDVIILDPTIIRRWDEKVELEYVMDVSTENALVVFRSEEEAEKFRACTGLHPASEGFVAERVDTEDIARICDTHGFDSICMPEPWTGTSGVDFFAAETFVQMLEESVPAED